MKHPLRSCIRLTVPLLCALFTGLSLHAQSRAASRHILCLADSVLHRDPLLAETLTDLVEVRTTQPMILRKRARHKTFVGLAASGMGFNWRKMSSVKQKFVGVSSRYLNVFHGVGKEWDINLFVIPHLEPYVSMARAGFDTAAATRNTTRQWRYDHVPWECPEVLKFTEDACLTVECETTPAEASRGTLDSLFLPLSEGHHEWKNLDHFGTQWPAFGMYGPWVLDCNHGCRPEIHPIEWLWWIDLSGADAWKPGRRTWQIALLRDDSRRFDHWSPAPLAGELSIPFYLPGGHSILSVNLDLHTVDAFQPAALQRLDNVPATALIPGTTPQSLNLQAGPEHAVTVWVNASKALPGVKVWAETNFRDPVSGEIFGKLHIAAAADNVFAAGVALETR